MPQFVSKRWDSKFARFIQSYGVEPLALELDITSFAIYHWIRGASIPRPAYAEVIQRLARDRGITLTMDDIYGHRRKVRTVDSKVATARWRSKLALFIQSYGVEALAAELDVRPSTICYWIRGATAPRQAHAEIIQRLALKRGSTLTMDEICAARLAGFRIARGAVLNPPSQVTASAV
jgi:hypothetical protein